MHASGTLGRPTRTLTAGAFVVIESVYRAGEVLPRHFHDDAFLTFASRGSFEEKLRTRAIACATYDVIARPAGEMHSNRYGAGGTSCVLIGIGRERVDGVARLFDEAGALPRGTAAPIAVRVARELADADDVSPLIIEGLILELLGSSLRCGGGRPRPPIGPAAEDDRRYTRRGAPWLTAARDYIHANASQPLTTGAIAAEAGVHPTTLSRAFREAFRCTPGEYLRRVRIENAIAALTTTDAPIADVAAANGFYDQSHLTNALRKSTRLTPAAYRRKN